MMMLIKFLLQSVNKILKVLNRISPPLPFSSQALTSLGHGPDSAACFTRRLTCSVAQAVAPGLERWWDDGCGWLSRGEQASC